MLMIIYIYNTIIICEWSHCKAGETWDFSRKLIFAPIDRCSSLPERPLPINRRQFFFFMICLHEWQQLTQLCSANALARAVPMKVCIRGGKTSVPYGVRPWQRIYKHSMHEDEEEEAGEKCHATTWDNRSSLVIPSLIGRRPRDECI